MLKKIIGFSVPVLALTPFVVSAQGIQGLIGTAIGIITGLIPLIIGLAVLLFLWGVLRYVFMKDDSDKKEARNFMMWGIIALFVMVSVWGLVNILDQTLLGTGQSQYNVPRVPAIPVPR